MPIDYSKYPPNWKTEIRPRILARAGEKCEFCFLQNRAMVWSIKYKNQSAVWRDNFSVRYVRLLPGLKFKKVKVVLTIAHLDHDEENHNVTDDRLAALCQRCHLRYDSNEKKKRRLKK